MFSEPPGVGVFLKITSDITKTQSPPSLRGGTTAHISYSLLSLGQEHHFVNREASRLLACTVAKCCCAFGGPPRACSFPEMHCSRQVLGLRGAGGEEAVPQGREWVAWSHLTGSLLGQMLVSSGDTQVNTVLALKVGCGRLPSA